MTDAAERTNFDEEPELDDEPGLSPIEGLVHDSMNVVVPAEEQADDEDDEPEA